VGVRVGGEGRVGGDGRVGLEGGVNVIDGKSEGVWMRVAVGVTEGENAQAARSEMKNAANSV
jgi:hypothetical protein